MKNSFLTICLRRYIFLLLPAILGLSSCKKQIRDNFTEQDVQRIQAVLNELSTSEYRIVLPTFDDGEVVGSKVYGRLPVTEISQVAVSQGISYSETGNLQAVFQSCEGGGAGSHTESESAAKGAGDRINQILENLDKSKFILIRN